MGIIKKYNKMKFFAAILASAAATEYTVCSFTQTYYAVADTTCTSTVSATETVLAIKGICTYSATNSAWFKLSVCDTTNVTQLWHSTAACSDTPAADQTVALDKDGKCSAVKLTGTTIAYYPKIAPLAGSTTSTLCGITFTNHLSTTVCTAAADTTTVTTIAN